MFRSESCLHFFILADLVMTLSYFGDRKRLLLMMDKAVSPLFIAGPTLSNRLHMASKKDHRVSQSFTSLQWKCSLSLLSGPVLWLSTSTLSIIPHYIRLPSLLLRHYMCKMTQEDENTYQLPFLPGGSFSVSDCELLSLSSDGLNLIVLWLED